MTAQLLLSGADVHCALPANLSPAQAQHFQSIAQYQTPDVRLAQFENVTIDVRGRVFGSEGIIEPWFASQAEFVTRKHEAFQRHRVSASIDPVELPGELLWICDRYASNFYHWIADSLPKLEAAWQAGIRLPLALPANVWQQQFVIESLAAFEGLEIIQLAEGRNVRINALQVVTRASDAERQNPALLQAVTARLRQHFAPEIVAKDKHDLRLWISRASARFRTMANEADLSPVLQRHGFQSVSMEKMPFADQVRLAADASVIAGPHGAGLANMAFMASGGTVLELRQFGRVPDSFFAMANACGHTYCYIECQPAQTDRHPHATDMLVEPGILDAELEEIRA